MKNIVFDENAFIPFGTVVNDTNDLYRIIEDVEGLHRFLFRDKKGLISVKAGEFLSSNMKNIFLEIEKSGLEPAADDKQADFLNAVIDYLKKMPQVKVTLAFEPNVSFIARLNNAITNEVGKKVVLDIYVRDQIVGGAIFEYGGKYFIRSLDRQIEEFIVNSEEYKNLLKTQTNL